MSFSTQTRYGSLLVLTRYSLDLEPGYEIRQLKNLKEKEGGNFEVGLRVESWREQTIFGEFSF